MGAKHVDRDNLTITGDFEAVSDELALRREDDVMIVVTRAFGPTGANLVGLSDVTFDDHPAVTLKIRAGEREGLVHLSPIHGDRRKAGFTDIEAGTKCDIYCPVSGQRLDHVGKADDGSGADYWALYLTPRLSRGEIVAISDVWGHYHSRILDNFEVFSVWAHQDERLAPVRR